jgi:hypothetical protein
METAMAFADRLSSPSASPIETPRRSATAVLRRAAHAAVTGARRMFPDLLVLATFGVLLAATVALRVLIWLPLFHAKP